MQLELEKPDTNVYVKHYQNGKIILPHQTYTNSIIITPSNVISECWSITHASMLTIESLELLFELNVDIYLLGTGINALIPAPEILGAFARLGKPLDFMDSGAACRTFNILANEARNVAAAIIA
ncbi:Mth938-like domain-containing protein [Fastidiosibacter lacustris]|uniref:Mth938-like domain-containing protein n=1 Tax=Fastidiosibacter lacustris TaxID=2056695 RepID=UPI000E350F21|nr:Mth938-like domain-containing protein [Fastidiosibacter lacustris]